MCTKCDDINMMLTDSMEDMLKQFAAFYEDLTIRRVL